MKKTAAIFALTFSAACIFPLVGLAADDAFNPHKLISDIELSDVNTLNEEEIQNILKKGTLANRTFIDHDGATRTGAQIIWRYAQAFGINPQFILVMLQKEQSIIEDQSPSDDQLDWAMGYAICDTCSKHDPALQKYRGFANQIFFASQKIADAYLPDLMKKGKTISGCGPGLISVIDGHILIPANYATSVLYTYTPHLEGNKNFVKIWHRWFSEIYPDGSLLKNAEDGQVSFIRFGKRLPVTSYAVLLSRFDPENIISVSPSVLQQYPLGPTITFQNYSLLRTPNLQIYLLVSDVLKPIPDQETFRSIGFNPEEIIDVSYESIAGYEISDALNIQTEDPIGFLGQDTQTGGVYFIEEGKKHPINSREILFNVFSGDAITPLSSQALSMYETSTHVPFLDGTLIGIKGEPAIYVISNGDRLPIADEHTFVSFGYKWDRIVWTDKKSVIQHPMGDILIHRDYANEPVK